MLLQPGQVINTFIDDWQWNFYSLLVNDSVGELAINIIRTSYNGNPEFYLQYGAVPNLQAFVRQRFYYSVPLDISVRNPKVGQWILGVFGRKTQVNTTATYEISMDGMEFMISTIQICFFRK